MATHVALFRNLNLGQGRSPTRTQLLEAFARAGVPDALSHQVNGTVAFDPGERDPQAVADEVVERLTPVTGYADVAPVLALADLADLPDLDGLPDGAELTAYAGRVPASEDLAEDLPWTSPGGELRVVAVGPGLVLSLNRDPGRSQATPVLERRLGVPVSSRGVPTVQRLLARLSRPASRGAG